MADDLPPRLRRIMNSTPRGVEAFEFLKEPAQDGALLGATKRGLPAVSGISGALLARFGEASRQSQFKQFIGLAVRHLLETRHSYVLVDRGVKVVGDPVFASGSRYRPRDRHEPFTEDHHGPAPSSNSMPTLMSRLVSVLDAAELRDLTVIIQRENARRQMAA